MQFLTSALQGSIWMLAATTALVLSGCSLDVEDSPSGPFDEDAFQSEDGPEVVTSPLFAAAPIAAGPLRFS